MSSWTNIFGVIRVHVPGRSDPQCRYIVESVLNHLPLVTGSEGDMEVYLNRCHGYNNYCTHDEYEMITDHSVDDCGCHRRFADMFKYQSDYLITIDSSLRDRSIEDTLKEFRKWLIRLSKRIIVDVVDVSVVGRNRYGMWETHKFDPILKLEDLYEYSNDEYGQVSWIRHLLWEKDYIIGMPKVLKYKYYSDEKNDEDVRLYLRR